MGANVLLVSVNQYDFPYPVFPLGLAQLEGALRRSGYHTRLVDWNVDAEPVAQIIRDFRPGWVGISLRNIDDALIQKRETFFARLKGLCEEVRRLSSAPIVLGGSGFSIFPERLLELSGADYGIQGEGEEAFPRLMEAVRNGGDLGEVPGLVFRADGAIRLNPRTETMAGSDIAAPSGVERLSRFYLERSSMMNVQTQRGCALHCCYCTYPLLEGRSYRRRPAGQVVDELERLARLGARYVFFVDSVFNSSAEHVAGICEAMLNRDLRLNWCCFLRPKGLTRELMAMMGRAGLRHIEYGSDSLCDSVLEEYGKRLTFEDIRHSSELAQAVGIEYAHYLICGGPGETYATLERSFERSRTLGGATFMARVGMRVYPGTPLHARMLRERGSAP
ncbi:MAG: cobalamin-dependent protein, partial [Verrucomicrobia bacterium]|nr:cobalamin-dependent protein [Verrucomicrobiota bacterium]